MLIVLISIPCIQMFIKWNFNCQIFPVVKARINDSKCGVRVEKARVNLCVGSPEKACRASHQATQQAANRVSSLCLWWTFIAVFIMYSYMLASGAHVWLSNIKSWLYNHTLLCAYARQQVYVFRYPQMPPSF